MLFKVVGKSAFPATEGSIARLGFTHILGIRSARTLVRFFLVCFLGTANLQRHDDALNGTVEYVTGDWRSTVGTNVGSFLPLFDTFSTKCMPILADSCGLLLHGMTDATNKILVHWLVNKELCVKAHAGDEGSPVLLVACSLPLFCEVQFKSVMKSFSKIVASPPGRVQIQLP